MRNITLCELRKIGYFCIIVFCLEAFLFFLPCLMKISFSKENIYRGRLLIADTDTQYTYVLLHDRLIISEF